MNDEIREIFHRTEDSREQLVGADLWTENSITLLPEARSPNPASETESLWDDFKTIGVRDISNLSFGEKIVRVTRSGSQHDFGDKEQFQSKTAKDKVMFPSKNLGAVRESSSSSNELFNIFTPPRPSKLHPHPILSFVYVKENPSSSQATLLPVSKNIIKLNRDNSVSVIRSHAEPVDQWEVEEGPQILKYLNPVPYSPFNSLVLSKDSSSGTNRVVNPNVMELQEGCSDFLSPVSTARLLVTNTISQAKEDHRKLIFLYGDSDRWSVKSIPSKLNMSSRWPSIALFTKEEGLCAIERYVFDTSQFKEDWRYVISFEGAQSDEVSDHYFYEAKFSLPTKLYPIAQVTAALYFHVEVCRVVPPGCPVKVACRSEISRHVVDPEKYVLRDNVLLRILDLKVLQIRNILF